jgi:signal transduction histidine kinase/ActR/RegA family two-component response regulator
VTEAELVAVEGEPLTRAFYDIAQLLESAETAEERVTRVLARLRSFVPYERCAVLDALRGREPRLIFASGTPASEIDELTGTITRLFVRLGQDHGHESEAPPSANQHLAVPLVGLDEVVGVLFVSRPDGAYAEPHLRALSVVAAKLAAYFSMLRARDVEAGHIRQLVQARQAAEIANRAKDEFLALVSHELRTPLNTILTWADALRSADAGAADRARAFEAIERNVLAQTKLIQDLLDLSCVAAAAIRLDLQAVEPATLIRDAIRSLRQQAKQKAITLEVSLDESVTPLIADPHRLTQIVANLVANAIKFTPEGGRVEVRLERAGMLAKIVVIDNGSGIDRDVLPTLFAPFRQANSSSTRPHGGLGVGLALVKDLVELHGGQVRVQSEGEQRGATFTVELPWGGAANAAASAREVATTMPDAPQALLRIRVLVVDDDEDTCEAIRMVLEDEGAVVATATSVAGALEALELSLPDVLLSDITMPGESGYDLMRKVVSRRGDAAPPAAAISGGGRADSVQEALASGFRMLLQKPVHSTALIGAVVALAGMTSQGDAPRVRAGGTAR